MNALNIVNYWNEFCLEQSYDDSMIYAYDGDEEFIKFHYCKYEDMRIDVKDAVSALNELKDRNGRQWYVRKFNGVEWYTTTQVNDQDSRISPVDWSVLKPWLEEKGVCI